MSGTVLDGADITQATLEGTRLSRMKIVATTGLESCVHLGPSLIDAHTLNYSDPLPLTFLQGCGLSNSELESLRSYQNHLSGAQDTDIRYQALSSPPTQSTPRRSCVISYQLEDVDLAKQLQNHLQSSGIRCWLDEREWLPDSDVDGQDSNHIRLWIRFSPSTRNAP